MEDLADWLPENIPGDDSVSIVHGDYRLENSIYHATGTRMLALLDWELSTIGHPLADLAYNCMVYHHPTTADADLIDVDCAATGIPTEEAYVEAYCRRTGRTGIEDWNFYLAFSGQVPPARRGGV
jgi:aminoglycoside phosphotransferase (APT) family kinase protein